MHDDPHQQQQQQQGQRMDIRRKIDAAERGMLTLANIPTPFIRKGVGTHAYARTGPLTLLILIIYTMALPSRGMLIFVPLWLLAVFVRMVKADRTQFSKFQGLSKLRIPFVRSEEVKRFFEGPLVFALGLAVGVFDAPLGLLLMAGGIGVAIDNAICRMVMRNELRIMHDQMIEMEIRAHDMKLIRSGRR